MSIHDKAVQQSMRPYKWWRFSSKLMVDLYSPKPPSFKLRRFLLYLLMFVHGCRFITASIALLIGWSTYFDYDSVLANTSKHGTFDALSGLFSVPVLASLYYLDYLIQFKLSRVIITLAYQLIVLNPYQFFTLNPQLQPSTFCLCSPVKSIRAFGISLAAIWNARQVKFHFILSKFQSLTEQHRARLVLIGNVYECIAVSITIVTTFIMFMVLVVYNSLIIVQQVAPLQMSFALCDLLSLEWIVFVTFKNCCLLGHAFGLINVAFRMKLEILDRLLASAFAHIRRKQVDLYLLRHKLAFFRANHWDIIRSCTLINHNIVSRLFFIGTLTNISLNVYFIAEMFKQQMVLAEKLWMLVMTLVQLIVWSLGAKIVISLDHHLTQSTKYLFQLQSQLVGGNYILDKLKLLSYYERVHSDSRFQFTMGSIGNITKKSVFEFLLIYAAYIMFAFRFVKPNNNYE